LVLVVVLRWKRVILSNSDLKPARNTAINARVRSLCAWFMDLIEGRIVGLG
jgi:hypothetical protein